MSFFPSFVANIKTYAIIGMAAIIATGAAYGIGRWQGGTAAEQRIAAKQAGEDAAAQGRQDEVLGIVAKAVAAQQPKNTTVYNKATDTVRENTIYKDCKLPEDMQELILQSQKFTP